MRLWHQHLIPLLPRQQLLGQHREACALRGKGWGKPHATVNYVFEYPYNYLYYYHVLIMREMRRRKYNVATEWLDCTYRGKLIGYDLSDFTEQKTLVKGLIYPEHDKAYLQECLENLKNKGIEVPKKELEKEELYDCIACCPELENEKKCSYKLKVFDEILEENQGVCWVGNEPKLVPATA